MRVWKIITDLTPEQNAMYPGAFSNEDDMRIIKLGRDHGIQSWDHEKEDIVIPYLICTEDVLNELLDIVEKYDIKFEPIDITEEFLMGLHLIPDEGFIKFREDNITEDIVYAKIKKYGGKSLDELEKSVLENF